MDDDPRPGRLAERVRQELRRDDGAPERVRCVVTETVPSPIPGELLVNFAHAATADPVTGDALDAAVAVEFAALHQYLHMIPSASASLVTPVAGSPYATDEVAAIIDSDWLQAAAFCRLSSSVEAAARSRRCYEALASGSTRCYEQMGRAPSPSRSPLAPLIGAAGRIGAIVGGLDREAAATVESVARAVGDTIRVQTPTGAVGAPPTRSPDWAAITDDLAGVVARPDAVVESLEDVVERSGGSGASR